MVWGVDAAQPAPARAHPRRSTSATALATPGVCAVLTADDVPGRERASGSSTPDQPALAEDVVRYEGEPVALVAADHPETARRAAKRIVVDVRGAAGA